MTVGSKVQHKKLPWYGWLLAPFAFLSGLAVMIPLGILALFSIPYFFVYPEKHRQVWDFEGTDHQRQLLAKWRSAYARLSFSQRISRAFRKKRRRSTPISKES